MDVKSVIIAFALFLVGQTMTWFQVFGQIKWPSLMGSNMWIPIVTSVPITIVFMYGTKYAREGFDGEAWPIRILTFSAGMVVFAIFTSIILNQPFNMKAGVSLSIALLLILIQIFWK